MLSSSEFDGLYGVGIIFFEDEICAVPGGFDILFQVRFIDFIPDVGGHVECFLVGEGGIAVEVGMLVLEGGASQ